MLGSFPARSTISSEIVGRFWDDLFVSGDSWRIVEKSQPKHREANKEALSNIINKESPEESLEECCQKSRGIPKNP